MSEEKEQVIGQSCCLTGSLVREKMMARTLLLAALLAVFEVSSVTGRRRGPSMPGSPQNISRNNPALQKLVFGAACVFNNQSNDAFLFKPAEVIRAQKQVKNSCISRTPHTKNPLMS